MADILAGGPSRRPEPKWAGVSHPTDIPGYTKLNAYRVWGNIFRASFDYTIGSVTGQLRAGFWSEWSATERERYYFDVTLCNNPGPCNAFKSNCSALYADQNTSSGTVFNGISGVGYHEHTGWNQYEPFLELEIRPLPDLTDHARREICELGAHDHCRFAHQGQAASDLRHNSATPTSFTTTRTLPFATVNYKIQPNWSVYAQYANGIYVPDISAFEVTTPIPTFPKPQTTTNYQFGTVYYGDNFSVDADIYYIKQRQHDRAAVLQSGDPPGPASDTCNFNAGTVIYKGVEGESTYAFTDDTFNGMLDGLAVFANGSLNSAKGHTNPLDPTTPSVEAQQAPYWTAATGLIYKSYGWKISLIDKITGQQYVDPTTKRLADGRFYRLPAFNTLDLTGSYDLGDPGVGADFEIGGGIYNLLNSRNVVSVTINDGTPLGTGTSVSDYRSRVYCPPAAPAGPPNPTCSLDQYFFQPERMFEITIKAHL